ncbi:hypothetical protein SAMD00019534_118680 [Acytostelium subglobosum LB1]|uniref:hypothetical protein n=1 Tax=Acytostelium subglobosum LB1 TaxID=1410327 RepID=UPI000644CBB1|nr:hypothetical protein SAMD00019534_118680 [Acytostelium subglobosum LB1]GAM28692.1 hypothetical protein SAMD00019534_118680 [Acytostelium subglobosum LB1]|eukprot:XP_012748470.1 hypothetical protein SAMD00019534_118680 [Acytostelium subglobosum LB1]
MKIQIEGSTLVDSLPYIDAPLTDQEQSVINELIREEMSRFEPPDYLAQLPAAHSFDYNSFNFLENEMNRIQENKTMEQFNLTRYKVEKPPASMKHDVDAWQSAVDNAKAQCEHQETRRTNLQLLQRYGVNAWKKYLEDYQRLYKSLKAHHDENVRMMEQINVNRKLDQETVQTKIESNQRKWYELVHKNKEIEQECLRLEIAIEKLQLEKEQFDNK